MLSSFGLLLLVFLGLNNRNTISADLFSPFDTVEHKEWNIIDYLKRIEDFSPTYSCAKTGSLSELSDRQESCPINEQTKSNDLSSSMKWLTKKIETTVQQFSHDLQLGEQQSFNLSSMMIMILQKVPTINLSDPFHIRLTDTIIQFPPLNLCSIDESIIINIIKYHDSSMMTLSLHNLNGTEIPIENTIAPFEFRIPHPKNRLMSPMIHYKANRTGHQSSWMYHYINLTHSNNQSIALHIEFQPEKSNRSYVFIIKFHGMPEWKNQRFDGSKLFCSESKNLQRNISYRPEDPSTYVYFLDNTMIQDHQWAIVGIHEIDQCDAKFVDEERSFSTDYSLRIILSGCYYLDENGLWQSKGVWVGEETNEKFTQCLSTHLTTYAAGFVVLPNPIDFNQLDPAFERNLTIYITLILVVVLYALTMTYSYFKDKVDATMLLVLPLYDNNPRDKYLYQLVVFTGMRKDAGTTSKVHFVLSGNNDETNVRTFSADRNILKRGHCDSFILAVPRPLGQLNYLRIWHDNSGFGSDASWFLKYIIVRDLQTMQTNYFICEKWLAVEKGTGEIDRTLTVASEEEQDEIKHILSKNAYRSMADNHLWFSIFAYHLPSAKRFTRMQRCTCCFVLLLMSLLMNILFYDSKENTQVDETNSKDFVIGPFTFSKEQVGIGILSEVIVFFPSLILVTLFRRTKARHPRTMSPVAEAINRIKQETITSPPTQSSPKKFNGRFYLPWWFLIIAYIFSILIAGVCITFIAIRGISYGDDKVRRWLASIVIGFFSSIFLTQPLKVLTLALLFYMCCRQKSRNEAFIEEEDPIEDFTVSTIDADKKFPPKSILARTRFDPYRTKREKERLKALREERLREIHSWFILRELCLLLVFLSTLGAICYVQRDVSSSHQMVHYLRHQFLQIDYGFKHQFHHIAKNREKTYVFENIRSIPDFWSWLETIFLQRIREMIWDDKETMTNKQLQMMNRTNRLIDWPVLRQLRVKNNNCTRKSVNKTKEIHPCAESYSWLNEDQQPFGDQTDTISICSDAFKYTLDDERGIMIHSSAEATYMKGGYFHDLRYFQPRNQMREELRCLRKYHWIDRWTRAVFLTFGLYNPNTNFFVYSSLLLEQLPQTGRIVVRASFHPFRLNQLYTGTELIYCFIYLALVIYYMLSEMQSLIEKGRHYLRDIWSYINWTIIICSWVGVGIHVYRELERKRIGQELKIYRRRFPINLQFLSYLDSVLTYVLAFCLFFGTIKILRLLRFNRRLSLLQSTLKRAARQIAGFILMASFVFFAFTSLFFLVFHSEVYEYSSWARTCQTCFEMISLHFSSVHDLQTIHPVLAAVSLFLFIFLAVFLVMNMFVSIIVDNFNQLRREQQTGKNNDIQLIEFIRNQIKRFIGLRKLKPGTEEITLQPAPQLTDRVDRLVFSVDKFIRDE